MPGLSDQLCGAEGVVDLFFSANVAEEPGVYIPTFNDCRPAFTCSDSSIGEDTEPPADNRPFELYTTTNININWDGVQADCECYLGDEGCNGGSCWLGAGRFHGSSNGNCCGDDQNLLGPGPFPPTWDFFDETYTWRKCRDTWDPLDVDTSACVENVSDYMCCDHIEDCVFDNVCYPDDNDVFSVELLKNGVNMTCSDGVWCPRYFDYIAGSDTCVYFGPTACYSNDPNFPSPCLAPFDTEEYWDDVWELPNPPPSSDCYDNSTSPDQYCAPFLDWQGALYYLYQDIDVY